MAIYNKPTWALMWDMVKEMDIKEGEVVTRERILAWFRERYPKIKKGTLSAHLIRMSINAPSRIYYSGKPKDDDLFYQIDSGHFRLYEPENDPNPIYDTDRDQVEGIDDEQEVPESPAEFAYESDLQNFLAKNLHLIEDGLSLYDDDGFTGLEYPAGGRRIDILATSPSGKLVVIELKVSRGYDRTVGQLLRYVSWVKENLAEPDQAVEGVIVAREISEDLRLACRDQMNIRLFEYELAISLNQISQV